MTPQQAERVQASFARLSPIADRTAGMFYERFTPAVSDAWKEACSALSAMMIAAADADGAGEERRS